MGVAIRIYTVNPFTGSNAVLEYEKLLHHEF